MLNTTPTLQKRLPAIVTEAARDEYQMRFAIRHRTNWRKLQPEQRAVIIKASAQQLETWAAQMKAEAAEIKNGGAL
jgi:hypothetical protein